MRRALLLEKEIGGEGRAFFVRFDSTQKKGVCWVEHGPCEKDPPTDPFKQRTKQKKENTKKGPFARGTIATNNSNKYKESDNVKLRDYYKMGAKLSVLVVFLLGHNTHTHTHTHTHNIMDELASVLSQFNLENAEGEVNSFGEDTGGSSALKLEAMLENLGLIVWIYFILFFFFYFL